MALEVLSEEDEEENSFDHDDELSVSLPSADGVTITQEGDGDEVSKAEKGKRGAKRSKAGVQLSPSKSKASRVKRADCWKYFKLISVASKKEFGVQITKAKCKFCSKSYVYHQGGATSQLNRHLTKCTQYLNKLAKAKANLAQGTLTFSPDGSSIVVNPTEYDHDHTRLLIA